MKPICLPCERFMRPKRNGYYFVEGKPWGGGMEWDGERGKDSLGWTPYKVWVGDVWACPDCGSQIINGVGIDPVAEHYQDGFDEVMTRTNARQLMVKDC